MTPRVPYGPIQRVWPVVLLGAVLALAHLGTGRDTAHAVVRPASTPTPTIELVTLDPWVEAVDTVTATLTVTGATTGSVVTPVLHSAVATRSSFALTTNGENLGGTIARLTDHPVDGSSAPITVRFAVTDGSATTDGPDNTEGGEADESVTLTRSGVYPLVFTLHDTDGTPTASMVAYLVRLPTATTDGTSGHRPLKVASQFRLLPTPSIDAAGDLTVTETARNAAGALVDGLGDAGRRARNSLGFAVSPAFVDSLNRSPAAPADDDPGEPGDARLGADLTALTDGLPLQSLPWAPLDLAGWLTTPDLAPTVERSLTLGDKVLDRDLTTPDRTVTDLGAWGAGISDQSLRWLTNHGSSAFLVPENLLDDLDTTAFPRSLAAPFLVDIGDDRTATAMQIDGAISGHFTLDDPVLGANHLIADLSVIALDLPAISRGTVVAPPVGWTPAPAFLSAYAEALETAHPDGSDALLAPTPLVDVVTNTPMARAAGDTVTEGPVLRRSLRDGDAPAPATALGNEMATTTELVDSLATMAPGGTARSTVSIRRMREEMYIAAMPGIAATERSSRFRAVRDSVTATVASIHLPPRQTITLTSDSASLPITIRRSADGPTKALVHIDAPSRLRFPDGRTRTVELTDSTTRLNIRVHSDAPGETLVRLTITSPDGRLVADTTELVVRSTAASGVGMIISLGSLGFLVVWWVRDIVRTRRRRRARHIPPAELIDID